MFRFILTLLLTVTSVLGFINPIIPGFNPDPSILAVGDDYFIVTSTFEFYPGHPIYHSKDLIDWKLIGHALNRPSQLRLYAGPPEGGIWAPTLRYYNGLYYLFTTNRWVYSSELRQQSRSFYVTTNDIFGGVWSDPIYIDVLGYDPDIFVEDESDGTAWITRCDINNNTAKIYGIYQNKIDLATGQQITPDELIFNGSLPLNSTARPEGPHLYKKDNYYYLLIAEGGTGVYHRSTIQRGPTPSGPWESYSGNPLIYNGVDPDPSTQPIQATGHSDIIQTADGQWWGTCLGIRPQGGNMTRAQLGRETFLFPVTWTDDGWPVFNNNQSIGLVGPGLYNRTLDWSSFHDSYDSDKLDESYYYLRTPYAPIYSLTARPGYLRLHGTPISLGDRDTPSILLRKQTAFNQLFETSLEFEPDSPKQEAGMTAFYSDFFHQDIAVTQCPSGNGSRCVVWRWVVNNNATATSPVVIGNATNVTTQYYPIPAGPVKLAIKAEETRYNFGYAVNGEEVSYVGSIDSVWVYSAPVGYSLFKGAHFGLYSQGGERSMFNNPADFDYWSQKTYKEDPVE
nr:uncharacterized protein CI109_004963 [Kwoniella shandongensis]KAA5526760.1 hypothetical protein CI109_004963 [Kwoniella shandongensis]